MLDIVTVKYEWTLECAETHQQLYLAVAVQNVQIAFETVVQGRLTPVVADDLVRFEMHMDGVPPATAAVAADPAFD